MLLPINANRVEQDFQPLPGRQAEVVGAIRGIGPAVAIEFADNALHTTILAVFPQAQRRRIHYNQ